MKCFARMKRAYAQAVMSVGFVGMETKAKYKQPVISPFTAHHEAGLGKTQIDMYDRLIWNRTCVRFKKYVTDLKYQYI